MPPRLHALLVPACALAALTVGSQPLLGQRSRASAPVVGYATLRAADAAVDALQRQGDLDLRRVDRDTLVPGRTHVRLQQVYQGVPVVGAEVTRQTDAAGVTVSIFGAPYADINLDTTPALSVDDATAIVRRVSGVELGPGQRPALGIVATGDGYHLAYTASAFAVDGATAYVIDAQSGAILEQRDALQRQSAVGTGTGVLGDPKKLSVSLSSGIFTTSDLLRPPAIVTYDMRGSLQRTLDYLNGVVTLGASDQASDADDVWTDGAAVDAHAYSGYFYDYYFKRFGRRGIDDNNFRMNSLVHPVRRSDLPSQPSSIVSLYYQNAFYYGRGIMVYGEGLPPGSTSAGQQWNYLSGALDVVAHELTHGVTDYTSRLQYQNESGALNESFSDMMGTAVEFFYQPQGSGPMKADYLIAEDVVTPGGIRSMENPAAYGQPDHYSRRALLPLSKDNGGVHTNSGIPNQMYYLAIEGGTNRTSGLSVQGVGGANRDQIEKVMYRAFTQMMPANATFATARAVTIQAAIDLYGAGSAAARAVTQAWTAVGVN